MTSPREVQNAAARRDQLAQTWLTPDALPRVVVGTSTDAHAELARLRSEGQLLGVWCATEGGYRYPAWQLTASGYLRPDVAELLAILPRGNGSGWSQVEWLYAPHPRLDGRRPWEVFCEEPPQAIDAARRQFNSHPDAGW